MSKEEAEKLDSLMKEKDKTEFINYCVSKSNDERQSLRKAYKEAMGKELEEALKSALSGDFEDCIVQLFKDPSEFDAEQLKSAIKGAGTDEDILIEILTSRTSDELQKISAKYQELYTKTLEEELIGDTSGDFQNLLKGLLGTTRSKNKKPKKSECTAIAQEIHDAVQAKNVDSAVIIKYFTTLSGMELQRVSQEYYKLSGKTMFQFIDDQYSGDFKDALKSLVYAVIAPSEYFATRVLKSIKGLGTNETLLNRVILSRYNKDMKHIKMFYNKLYNKDMVEDIAGDLSGDYMAVIKALIDFKN